MQPATVQQPSHPFSKTATTDALGNPCSANAFSRQPPGTARELLGAPMHA
ncbi:MAG: hypothetical protein ACK583_00245 [Cyanobacteriota bacterium]